MTNLTINGAYVSHGIFEDRIYLNTSKNDSDKKLSSEEIKNAIMKEHLFGNTTFKAEPIGAGVRSYGNTWGKVLAFFGFAVKLRMSDNESQDIYVNTKSLNLFVFHRLALDSCLTGNPTLKEIAHKTDDLYRCVWSHEMDPFEYLKEFTPSWKGKSREDIGEESLNKNIQSYHETLDNRLARIKNIFSDKGFVKSEDILASFKSPDLF